MSAWEGEDPEARATRSLLSARDQAFIDRVDRVGLLEPPRVTIAQLTAMSVDERFLYDDDLGHWHAAMPFYESATAADAFLQLDLAAPSSPGPAADLEAVLVVTGRPGVGKSKILQQRTKTLMLRAARLERLKAARGRPSFYADRSNRPGGVLYQFAPVVHISLDRRVNEKGLFRALCDSVHYPYDDDPQKSFADFVDAAGTRTVIIDEIQFVNFDGQTGRYVHDALKWITNGGRQLILGGHNMRWLMRPQTVPAREASRLQSDGRWQLIDVDKLAYTGAAERADWIGLLQAIECRIKLAGHDEGEPVLSDEFAEYLWVVTLGYQNHLATLLKKALTAASRTSRQRLTMKILDAVGVEKRAQTHRQQRLTVWREGQFPWTYDWPVKDDLE